MNKFKFYEVVEIRPKNGVLDMTGIDTRKMDFNILIGKKGVIMGMVQGEGRGEDKWYYDIFFEENEQLFTMKEEDLVSTGIQKKRSDFYSGESIRVRVDPKTGEGEIIDE